MLADDAHQVVNLVPELEKTFHASSFALETGLVRDVLRTNGAGAQKYRTDSTVARMVST